MPTWRSPASTGAEDDEPPRWTRVAFPLAGVWSSDTMIAWRRTAWWIRYGLLPLDAICFPPRAARREGRARGGRPLRVSGASAAYRLATVDLRREAVVVASAPVAVRFEPTSAGTVHFRA